MKVFHDEETKKTERQKTSDLSILSSVLVVITVIVFFLILLISYNLTVSFRATRATLNRYVVCEQSRDTIKSSANELSDLARMFVVNHDERFVIAYIDEIEVNRSQKKAIENLKAVCSDKDVALQHLEIAMKQADSLTQMELYNMRLCYDDDSEIPDRLREIKIKPGDLKLSNEERHNLAIKNIFSNGFFIYKIRLNENCLITIREISTEIKHELEENTEKLGQNLDRLRILILVLLVVNALSGIGLKEFKNFARSYNKMYEIGERTTQSLLKKAEYDSLTGILNRRAYEEICENSAKEKMCMALLLIDIDNFKHINDTYGHDGGDIALKKLALILKDTFRNGDYVARIGGDEFAVILTNFRPEGFKIVSDKVEFINERLAHIEGLENVSVSVGMAYSPNGFSESLYKQADKALYAVKEAGKKDFRIYEDEENS
ncbi:GGDEF domain-containing protein [uncultured Treponema sp.]|uniref:GGDEF domain-containing protein n=1 Tax=uncultured Treponema sp. TaxID=162155 RepID=UPI0025CF881C|nr:GGDEF domain-containing protein [uncultured Treponema sp.]